MPKSNASDFTSVDLDTYLDQLSSAAATPGGGAATALTGAQAAALLSMVCNLSAGRKYDKFRKDLQEINKTCDTGLRKLLALATEDAVKFSRVLQAYRLPRTNDDEVRRREAEIQQALKEAAAVPLEVMQTVSALLPLSNRLAMIGNPNLITDVGVALHLIEACICSARLNVLINLRQIGNAEFISMCNEGISSSVTEMALWKSNTLERVEELLRA